MPDQIVLFIVIDVLVVIYCYVSDSETPRVDVGSISKRGPSE